MSKIAIFGGTFNPIHTGHIHLCLECDRALQFDRILLMPTNMPPHKQPKHLLSNEDRLMMCKLACRDYPKIQVSDLEMRMQGVSYTVHTVKELRKVYPHDDLYWMIGSDMLLSFHQWYRYEEILQEVSLVAGAREENEYEEMLSYVEKTLKSDRVHIVPIEALPISSTQIREELFRGEKPECLAEEVYAYIKEHGLYQKG